VDVFLAISTAWQRMATIAADVYDRAGGFERNFVSVNEVPEKNPI
jgi:hypothetical protein